MLRNAICKDQCYTTGALCGARRPPFACSLPREHTGPHVACRYLQHDLAVWERADDANTDAPEMSTP